jgi:Txe/YoeB family toxin of Txe-Axe toxin-antitoxin module
VAVTTARRSPYEVIIDPACTRPHARKRTSVTALFAPDDKSAVKLLIEQLDADSWNRMEAYEELQADILRGWLER